MIGHQMKRFELIPDIWVITTSLLPGGGPNSGLIISGNEVILIDSSFSLSCGKQLLLNVHQITSKSPSYIINTHSHGDHLFGNEAFAPPAMIVAHENVRKTLISQGQNMIKSFASRWSHLIPDISETTLILPDITFTEKMTLHFAGRSIDLIHPGPAHTNSDIMIYLPEQKILFTGDLFFNHVFPPVFGSISGWITALETIEAMEFDIIVPGHGPVATKKELTEFKNLLIDMRNQVEQSFTHGLSIQQAIKDMDLPCKDWPQYERLNMNVPFIYQELREESSGYP
ncbi:MAG: MBL fold metallo-hydrolase [Chloroflexi bacterium]|nr:MBL fold metallo-hydrolase [Chloroflexota bacterium]